MKDLDSRKVAIELWMKDKETFGKDLKLEFDYGKEVVELERKEKIVKTILRSFRFEVAYRKGTSEKVAAWFPENKWYWFGSSQLDLFNRLCRFIAQG